MRIKLIFSLVSAIILIMLLRYLEVNVLGVSWDESVTKSILVDPLSSLVKTIFNAIGSPFKMITNFFTKQMPPKLAAYANLMAFLTVMMMIVASLYIVWRLTR